MKSQPWFRAALLTLLAFSLVSCGKSGSMTSPNANGSSGTASDDAQITQELANYPQFWQEDLAGAVGPLLTSDPGTFAVIEPLRFWRQIDDVQTEKQIEYSNPDSLGRPRLAIATIHRTLTGSFFIAARDTNGGDTSFVLVKKPLLDDWTRRVAFVRHARRDTGLTRWRLAGTSGVDVRTRDGVTRLQSLRIQAGAVDTTITDPLELHRLRQLIKLPPDVPIVLTARTAATDDVVLFRGSSLRRRFVNNGDGTHTFTLPGYRFDGLRHFAVDALSNGTLFDDAANYDANAWILPYIAVACRFPDDDRDDDGRD